MGIGIEQRKTRIMELRFIPPLRDGKCHTIAVKINKARLEQMPDFLEQQENSMLLEEGTERLLKVLFPDSNDLI